jgi:hypothetical protein
VEAARLCFEKQCLVARSRNGDDQGVPALK